MDLFDDLPPLKASGDSASKKKVFARGQQPLASKPAAAFDLFADLPASSSAASIKEDDAAKGERKANEIDLKRKSDDATDSDISTAKKPALEFYRLRGTFAERKGERDEMQDTHVLIEDFSKSVPHRHPSIGRLSYFAVFDGHAGARAAKWASGHLHHTLADKFPRGELPKVEGEIKRTLIDTYKKTDEDFLKTASKNKPSWKDGTTATTILVINNTLYIANLGDSKAIICRYNEKEKKYTGITLSTDHSPSDYSERMRIQKAGGVVREGRVMGVLEVSRSIGDGPYKNHGVSCLPDVKRCQLTDNDRWVLIACDGLWKTFNNDEAVTLVNQILDEPSSPEGTSPSQLERRQEAACNRLASDAVRRLSADNVTVVLVTIRKPAS